MLGLGWLTFHSLAIASSWTYATRSAQYQNAVFDIRSVTKEIVSSRSGRRTVKFLHGQIDGVRIKRASTGLELPGNALDQLTPISNASVAMPVLFAPQMHGNQTFQFNACDLSILPIEFQGTSVLDAITITIFHGWLAAVAGAGLLVIVIRLRRQRIKSQRSVDELR
jgi:hypothetical protein